MGEEDLEACLQGVKKRDRREMVFDKTQNQERKNVRGGNGENKKEMNGGVIFRYRRREKI